ncbi:MAG TPA: hypothetical protein VLC53_11710, partial [Myxococcota bacterium]|nr:hypothetical protein [Myxococcota bacterium]
MTGGELARAAAAGARTFGLRGATPRATFELRRAAGLLRRAPRPIREAVGTSPLPPGWPFVPDAARLRSAVDRTAALDRAQRVLAGEHHAYRWTWRPRPRSPEDWREFERTQAGARAPWFASAENHGGATDVKDAWEPGRFAWAYDLARGYLITGEDRFANEFWTTLEAFVESCPPFGGVQWGCGQETAIRAFALLWAEGTLAGAPSSTPGRLTMLRELLAVSAERIVDAIAYALSQRNNHGISEAAGLIAIGA